MQGQAGDQIANREHRAAGQRQLARPEPEQGRAGPRGRGAEREDGDAERDRGVGERPAELRDQERLKKAPGIHRPEADLQHGVESKTMTARGIIARLHAWPAARRDQTRPPGRAPSATDVSTAPVT